jgi:hypothetical protein
VVKEKCTREKKTMKEEKKENDKRPQGSELI